MNPAPIKMHLIYIQYKMQVKYILYALPRKPGRSIPDGFA